MISFPHRNFSIGGGILCLPIFLFWVGYLSFQIISSLAFFHPIIFFGVRSALLPFVEGFLTFKNIVTAAGLRTKSALVLLGKQIRDVRENYLLLYKIGCLVLLWGKFKVANLSQRQDQEDCNSF